MANPMKNWFHSHSDDSSFGDRIADVAASFIGSWTFVIFQSIVMMLWVLYNATALFSILHGKPFDPFPFIFLNLFMSAEAAYSTPLIMMSQNRSSARDRVHAEHDYMVNERTLALLMRICTHFDVRLDEIGDEIEKL